MNVILPFSLNTTEILRSKFKQGHVLEVQPKCFPYKTTHCADILKDGFRSGLHEAGAGK